MNAATLDPAAGTIDCMSHGGMQALLVRWAEVGWLRALDAAFARFLARELSDASPLLLLAAALASHQLGRGHACLDLADTLADPSLRDVSGGRTQGHAFYCVAMLGAPTLWADARESFRAGRLIEGLQRSATALRRHRSEPLRYRFDGGPESVADSVAAICPLVSQALTQEQQVLEAVAFDPATASQMFSLGMHAAFDDWRRDPSVVRAEARTIEVIGHGRIPVMLDGETMRLGRAVTVSVLPKAFQAMVPTRRDATPAPTKAP